MAPPEGDLNPIRAGRYRAGTVRVYLGAPARARSFPCLSPQKQSGQRQLPITSLQSLAERLRSLPGLFVADVGVAHGGADIFVPEELLDFPQILSHMAKCSDLRT